MTVALELVSSRSHAHSAPAFVAMWVGASGFVLLSEKRYPDGFQPGFTHRLALLGTLWHLLLEGPLLILMLTDDTGLAESLGMSTPAIALLSFAVACPLCYGLTRLGLRTGARQLNQLEEVRRKKQNP